MRIAVSVLLLCLLVSPADTQDFDRCDDRVDLERGEKPGGPLFGVGMLMAILIVAEKLCGAKGLEWEPAFARIVTEGGCPIDSKIGTMIMRDARLSSRADALTRMMTEGSDTLSADQVAEAKAVLEQELGGCAKVVDWYDHFKRTKGGEGSN